MSDLQAIQATVTRARNRLRADNAWKGCWTGLVIGAALYLATLALYKFLPIPELALAAAGLTAILAVAACTLHGFSRPITAQQAARWLDARQELKERLSTALEISSQRLPQEWQALVLKDAAQHSRNLDPNRLLPWRLPASCRWAFLLLLFAFTLGLVPAYRNPAELQKQKDTDNIRQAGKQIAAIVRRTVNQRQPALEPTKEALESVAKLGDHLANSKLTRSEALKDLASATDRLKQEARDYARNPALKKMDAAARTSTPSATGQNSDLQKQIDELNKSLGNKAAKPDAIDELRKELQKMQQAGKSMADKDATSGDAAREQLSQALAELARKSDSMGLPLPSLEEAIAALAANRIDQFLRDLNTAEQDLEKLQSMAQTLQQLQQQAEKVGKDLAEQLKNGQAQAALSSLERLKSQVEKANLSAADLKKILEELDKAIKPAGEYGKVGEHLKQAAGELKDGKKGQSASALNEASKELAKMLEQLGDAQSLASTMDALKRAQMAIGNGMSWALAEMPGLGQGGRPGRGVGTWGDDSQLLDVTDIQDGWDNSGVERPDADPRGLTDRGEGSLADSLVPTRVKGQMSPGGPMPSITLRGVSIKGQSSVQYTEAVMSAQSDAQSALSQDQVPRAYQGAVKNYFDDLK